ncbi:hypothetical protein GCM10010404_78330 [Nonomuraea africana]|uniref:Ig-like domain-containing protein n=1 Tax=Nonomuraea africana TaxID=46171 RepID=A0ABR9KK59_9ACTN|nr:hypothetical protein [Nonomuraea africana]MBE1561927.1 hypothetical protein [Nonomuraea africana]
MRKNLWWRRALAAAAALCLSTGVFAAPANAAAAPTVRIAAVKASPVRNGGQCPASTVFSATVTVKGAARLTYRWIRSDGSKSVVKSVRAGARVTLRERRSFSGSTRGWQAVQVLSPKKLLSKRAHFSVSCEAAPRDGSLSEVPGQARPAPTASAEVTGDGYSGTCPAGGGTLRFTGTIKVSRVPAAVSYRWVDSDGGALGIERLWFSGSATRTVTSGRAYLTSQSGTRWIEILSPDGRVLSTSNRAPYRVTCAADPTPPPVVAKVTNPWVTPAGYQGSCTRPLQFTFHATLEVSKPAKVTYRWTRSDGTTVPGAIEITGNDLTRDLTLTWPVADPARTSGGSAWVEVTSPGHARTQPVKFTIACVDISFSETRVASPAQPYTGACPVTVRTTATITVTGGPVLVWHYWRYPGTSVTSERISGSRTYTRDWVENGTTTGSTALGVATGDDYGHWKESAPITWSVTCRADEPGQVTVSKAAVTTWSGEPGACTTANPYQLTAAAMVTATKGLTYPLTVTYRWRWDDGGFWQEEKLQFTEPGTRRATHTWRTSRSHAAKVWLDVTGPAKVQGEPGEYSLTCNGKPPTPNTAGKVVSVTNPAITPSSHTGACPVDLKATATITVSAPTSVPVEYAWRFDNNTSSPTQQITFPEGGPLTRTVEWKDWRAIASTGGRVTGYLQVVTPNTAVSEPVSYSVTCG